MGSMTAPSAVLMVKIVVMFAGVLAFDTTAMQTESKNNDEVHHHGNALETVKHLRRSTGVAALPSHFTRFAHAGSFPPNLSNFAQTQQHANHILDKKKSSRDGDDRDGSSDDKCPDGAQFSITAPSAPRITGCFLDTGVKLFDEPVYSQTGNDDVNNQAFVAAYKNSAELDPSGEPLDAWVVVYAVSETEAYGYCLSSGTASDTHPADAETWYCDLEQNDAFEEVDEDDFDVDCGCLDD